MDREVVKELIQDELNEQNLIAQLNEILLPEHQAQMKKLYAELKNKLGGKGASERAAKHIHHFLHP
jgi:lipid-A-disaccharide synthase